MNKIYIVSYNAQTPLGSQAFHNHIQKLYPSIITDWWHYFTSTYIIVSQFDVNTLYNNIFPGMPGQYLLITEINIDNAQGWLPKAAWDWLGKYRNKQLK